jgi:hypothetical protein
MGKKGSAYSNLVKTHNRSRRTINRSMCECGKMVYNSQMERHLTTKFHSDLMLKKKEYEEFLCREKVWRYERLKWLDCEISRLEEERNDLVTCNPELHEERTTIN